MGKPAKTTMKVDARVATLIRRLAGYEGRRLSETLEAMLECYVEARWPSLELTYDDTEESAPKGVPVEPGSVFDRPGAPVRPVDSTLRVANSSTKPERRKRQRRGTKKPLPAPPGADRRSGKERRKKR
jgi:hypothetical protein